MFDISRTTRDKWEIDRNTLTKLELLGSGNFGDVWRGEKKTFSSSYLCCTAARGHLLKKRDVGTPGGKLLTGWVGCKSKMFSRQINLLSKSPLNHKSRKAADRYANAHKITSKLLQNYYGKINTFPTIFNFLYFSLEVWERRSHAFRRYGYSVPTRFRRK